ncbi:putative sugar transferase EpsL [Pirellulimonas nuda]|uniref:Putative sugar transferase EpsL n=1 Tax=Pirellulimonas nuda TaxID=2528009 RepID=A0A518DCW8_9BACT|nr:sugar transferase [Pirellulimonas nuda]QDU89327.1 putative sugar transferase EpsL [Pirellulimonas nuda]
MPVRELTKPRPHRAASAPAHHEGASRTPESTGSLIAEVLAGDVLDVDMAAAGDGIVIHPSHAQRDALDLAAGRFYLMAKRLMDIAGGLLALLLFSPVMAVAAALIKLHDGGPVLFAQTRVGLNGREFRCLKFRSMVVDADRLKVDLHEENHHDDPRTFKIPNDPRVTWIGRLLRRGSIDEMPQLFNVLRGDMSLVGPRPPVPSEVEKYSWRDMQRFEAKPGLTCIWQVSGRSRLSFPEQIELDLDYIENRSLWLDARLILLTLPAVLSGDGAY